jgi:hypothetical protein
MYEVIDNGSAKDLVLRHVFDTQRRGSGQLGMSPSFFTRQLKNGGVYGHTPLFFSSTAVANSTSDLLDSEGAKQLFDSYKDNNKDGKGYLLHIY